MLYLGFRHGICLKIIERIKHSAGLRKSKISAYENSYKQFFSCCGLLRKIIQLEYSQ